MSQGRNSRCCWSRRWVERTVAVDDDSTTGQWPLYPRDCQRACRWHGGGAGRTRDRTYRQTVETVYIPLVIRRIGVAEPDGMSTAYATRDRSKSDNLTGACLHHDFLGVKIRTGLEYTTVVAPNGILQPVLFTILTLPSDCTSKRRSPRAIAALV